MTESISTSAAGKSPIKKKNKGHQSKWQSKETDVMGVAARVEELPLIDPWQFVCASYPKHARRINEGGGEKKSEVPVRASYTRCDP
jgi:hypothetical protein